ncbi:hypothetical protein DV736_g4756, partial [Chaetothyriales sp. CBS 134916]
MVVSRRQRGAANLPPDLRQQAGFDAESGQVFTETSVSVGSRQHSDWTGELKTPLLLKKSRPNASGARSLAGTARTKVIRNFRCLTPEHFASIPWDVAQKIWQEVVEGESFHAWAVLASSYPDTNEFGLAEYRYHLEFKQPSLPLQSYLHGLAPAQSPWLLALRLSPGETRIADLMLLGKVPNLAVLDLSDGQVSFNPQSSSFDERVLRAWSELASLGSFKQLRVLLLGWQVHVDQWLFDYLPFFPNLQQVMVTDCPKLHQKNRKEWEDTAADHGWEARHSKRSAKSLRPYIMEPNFALGAVSGLYYTTLHGAPSRPMLECWIGTPRKWMHILDDFPGTRTIYFDRVQDPLRTQSARPASGKRIRHQQTISSTPTSPEPKRMQKPKIRTAAPGRQELDGLLSHYAKQATIEQTIIRDNQAASHILQPAMARFATVVLAASALLAGLPATLAAAQPGTIGFSFDRKRVSARDAPSLVRRQSKTVLSALSNELMLYLINVTVGTPPQAFSLQLDTGSSDIWFPAQSASICTESGGCPVGTYNQEGSSSYSDPNLPAFEIQYVDGTEIEGDYISDVLRIGSTTLTNMTMAQATKLNAQGIGIMGVGFTSGESAAESQGFTYPNVIDVLKSEGFINTKAYSLWLDSLDSNVGSILFGGIDSSKFTGDLVALPIQLDSQTDTISSFTVAWTGLTLTGSGNHVNLSPSSPQAAILDSGTTDTLLPDDIANSIFNGVGVTSDPTYGNVIPCKVANDDLTFSFGFGGETSATVNVSLSEFVTTLLTTDGSTPTFANGDEACSFAIDAAGQNPILFGDSFLRSAYVVYDLDDQLVGLAQTNFNADESNGKVQAFQSGSSGIPGASTTLAAVSVAQTFSGYPQGGLTRRRGAGGGAAAAVPNSDEDSSSRVTSPGPRPAPPYNDRTPETAYEDGENGHKIAYDPRDIGESAEKAKQPKLTLMEEVLLLGLKDKQGYLSFWNDNISYALRGCIVIELALRGRISMQSDSARRRFPLSDRIVEVIDDSLTGEVLLDEALKMMKSSEKMSVGSWIDLMSGETWNLMKIGYQLKQVRERLAKGLVDKGILRTEKRNFLLFDMATHPVVDSAAKDEIRKRVRNVCSNRTVVLPPSQFLPAELEFRYLRTITMVCAAYAANVLENALVTMSHESRERAFAQVDELLAEYSQWPFGRKTGGQQSIGANIGQAIQDEVDKNKDAELQLEVMVAVPDNHALS